MKFQLSGQTQLRQTGSILVELKLSSILPKYPAFESGFVHLFMDKKSTKFEFFQTIVAFALKSLINLTLSGQYGISGCGVFKAGIQN